MAIFAEIAENECIIISGHILWVTATYWPIYIAIMIMQYEILQQRPLTNVILVNLDALHNRGL